VPRICGWMLTTIRRWMMDDGTTGELGGSRTRRTAVPPPSAKKEGPCGENETDLVDLLRMKRGAAVPRKGRLRWGAPVTRTSRLVVRCRCRCAYVYNNDDVRSAVQFLRVDSACAPRR
jgi:hypothetical protein